MNEDQPTELPATNRQIVLRRRPQGLVDPSSDLETVERPMPEPGEGEALIRTRYLGLDATVRSWLDEGEGYLPPVQIGEVVRCSGIGEIVASRSDRLPVGTIAYGLPGWQEYGVVPDDPGFTTALPADADLVGMISLYGATGATAYFGLLEIGRPEEGETVVVSAAAGATGSIAGQIAKLMGFRVVGIAGSDEKCRMVVDDLGFDACINRRTDDIKARLRELCPDGVDVYFDNVGGPILDIVLGRLAMHGRVVLCGAIAGYNDERRPPGPSNYVNLISRRGRMEGFIALDYIDRMAESALQLAAWVEEGKMTYKAHLFEGLDAAPDALNALFTGDNIGKVIVAVAP